MWCILFLRAPKKRSKSERRSRKYYNQYFICSLFMQRSSFDFSTRLSPPSFHNSARRRREKWPKQLLCLFYAMWKKTRILVNLESRIPVLATWCKNSNDWAKKQVVVNVERKKKINFYSRRLRAFEFKIMVLWLSPSLGLSFKGLSSCRLLTLLFFDVVNIFTKSKKSNYFESLALQPSFNHEKLKKP